VFQKKSWLVKSTIIPEDFSKVEINNVTDYPKHREYLRNRRVIDISNGDVLAHTRQPSELTISNLITSVFEHKRKAYIYQILVKEELERVGKNLAEEENRLDGVENGLTAVPQLLLQHSSALRKRAVGLTYAY